MQERLIGFAGEVEYLYDHAGRPQEIRHSSFKQTIPPQGFDAAGRLREVHTQDASGFRTASFTYDQLDHLQKEKGRWNHDYQTDSFHNRRKKNGLAYQTNARHQLLSQGETAYRYDPNGNLIAKQERGETTVYAYDALDRLTAVRKGEEITTYTYDAFHRRLSKRTKDKEECYLYVGENEIGSVCQGEIQELRILGQSFQGEWGAVAIELKGKAYAPLYDCQKDLVALIDSSTGKIEESYSYSAFGEEKIYNREGKEVSDSLNPWRFACKRKDAETGWVYFGRRFYDPEAGRWTTPDPLLFFDGSNPYAYLHHSPLMAYDRNGLLEETYDETLEMAWNADDIFGPTDFWDDFGGGAGAWGAGLNEQGKLSNCRLAMGGMLHGTLDFVSRTINDISMMACILGSNDVAESIEERWAIQASFFEAQEARQQSFDHWVASTLSSDPNNATYQSFRNYTGIGLEVASIAIAGVETVRLGMAAGRMLVRGSVCEARIASQVIRKEIGCATKEGMQFCKQNPSHKIPQLEGKLSEWLGKETKMIKNKAGDHVFFSKDGARKVRFDLNHPAPHINPHGHIEEFINGKWAKSGPIYPNDVPHY